MPASAPSSQDGIDTAHIAVSSTDIKVPRIHALDAMRGIFSLIVVMGHFFVTMPSVLQYQYDWMLFTPLRVAPAFVVTFFMLSGFVLALPYAGPKPPGYGLFLIKRLSRLYLPFAILMTLAFVLFVVAGMDRPLANDMSFHIKDLAPPDGFTLPVLGHILMLTGLRKDDLIDPAIWSLAHELRISLVFPLLVLLCRRTWRGVSTIVFFYIATFVLQYSVGHYAIFPALTDDYASTWITTLYIAPCFMFGILLVKHRDGIVRYLSGISATARVMLWGLVAINFCFMTDFQVRQPFTEFASALLLMLVLSSEKAARMAETPVLQWLGRISYSTYLVHLPILFVLRKQLQDKIDLIWIFLMCIVLTLPAATLAQRFIEVPARRIGKKIAAAL